MNDIASIRKIRSFTGASAGLLAEPFRSAGAAFSTGVTIADCFLAGNGLSLAVKALAG